MKKDIFTIFAGVIALALLLSLSTGLLASPPPTAQAALGGFGGGPFGGRILKATECTCSGSTLLLLGPPSPGLYMVTPATIRHPHNKLRTGEWTLGRTVPGFVPCLSGLACFPKGFGAPVSFLGTSNLRGGIDLPSIPF